MSLLFHSHLCLHFLSLSEPIKLVKTIMWNKLQNKEKDKKVEKEKKPLLSSKPADEESYGGTMSTNASKESMITKSGVKPTFEKEAIRKSFVRFKAALDDHENREPSRRRDLLKTKSNQSSKSFRVKSDGSVSYLTPAEMGRLELYENLPMTAVMGLQKKEKSMRLAFASFAADLDSLDKEEGSSLKDKMDKRSEASVLLVDEMNMDDSVLTTPLLSAVALSMIAQLLNGYNSVVVNAAESVAFPGHSTGSWALSVSILPITALLGASFAGSMAESQGRHGALVLTTWTFLIGGAIQTFAANMVTFIVSRAIIGIACGFTSVLIPLYLGELAPPTLRGTFGTLTQFGGVIGILGSDLLAFPFGTATGWRILFMVTPILALTQLLLSSYMLESPRWLLGNDEESSEARYIIKKLRGLRFDYQVDTETSHYISALKAHKHDDEGDTKHATLADLVSDSEVRLLVLSTFALHMAQQLCGINAVLYYSNMFFEGVIDNPLVGTTFIGTVNFLATFLALRIMDSCGRRVLIMWSSAGMMFCCIGITLSFMQLVPNMIALVATNLYVGFFAIGLGSIPWLIAAEFFEAKYVAVAMSSSSQLNWSCNALVAYAFPYLQTYLGPYVFVPFAIVLFITFLFAAFVLPESQGHTPEELHEMLVQKNSDSVYHNMDIYNSYNNPIDLEWKEAMNQLQLDFGSDGGSVPIKD